MFEHENVGRKKNKIKKIVRIDNTRSSKTGSYDCHMLLSVVSNFDNSNATFIVDSSSNELAKDGNKESLPSSVTYYVYRLRPATPNGGGMFQNTCLLMTLIIT